MKTPDFVTDIEVGGKTIEDIKKWLVCCAIAHTDECGADCENCEYDVGYKESIVMGGKTLAYIQQLEAGIDHAEKVTRECAKSITENLDKLQARLAQVERERDALHHDLAACFVRPTKMCRVCENIKTKICNSCEHGDLFKWRGVCPENTKEEGK